MATENVNTEVKTETKVENKTETKADTNFNTTSGTSSKAKTANATQNGVVVVATAHHFVAKVKDGSGVLVFGKNTKKVGDTVQVTV